MSKISFLKHKKHIHFIGIGGAGMSAIAHILLSFDYVISGSDIKESMATIRLRDKGVQVFIGHHVDHLRLVDVVVYSNAITFDNPELSYAVKEHLLILKRVELLNYLMASFSRRVVVVGTHGKTTTSAMIAQLLRTNDEQSSFVIGSDFLSKNQSADLGNNDICVVEADESDGSFLLLDANYFVLTNIEFEHMDYFKSEDNLLEHFRLGIEQCLSKGGIVFLNRDDEHVFALSKHFSHDSIRFFSLKYNADFVAQDFQFFEHKTTFSFLHQGVFQGAIELPLFGKHNIYNALAAVAVAYEFQWSLPLIQSHFSHFPGLRKRCECVGTHDGITVYNDYAHHPTEINTTLQGLKEALNRRIICVFQPHRYTRTQDLFDQFLGAFSFSDYLVITQIYASFESTEVVIDGLYLFEHVRQHYLGGSKYVEKKSFVPSFLMTILQPNDVVVVMGAGDIHSVSQELLVCLKKGVHSF